MVLRDNYERDVALADKFNTRFITHPPRKSIASTLHNGLVGRQTRKSTSETPAVRQQ